jgi:hypothetical protein
MGEDGMGDAFRLALVKLFGDRRVTDLHMIATPDHRPGDRGPVAD